MRLMTMLKAAVAGEDSTSMRRNQKSAAFITLECGFVSSTIVVVTVVVIVVAAAAPAASALPNPPPQQPLLPLLHLLQQKQ